MSVSFSIIVPIYNTELYLEKCIDSVLNQKYDTFELILVNDGSTDRCDEICEKYKELDNRVDAIHKQNGGVSSARNVGIDVASGEYLLFVDSDDTMCDGLLNRLNKIIQPERNDIYFGEITTYNISNGEINVNRSLLDAGTAKNGNQIEILFKLIASGKAQNWSMSQNVFKRKVLLENNICLDTTINNGEDGDFFINFVLNAKKFGVAEESFVKYNLCRNGSICTSPNFMSAKSVLVFSSRWFEYFLSMYKSSGDNNAQGLVHFFAGWFVSSVMLNISRGHTQDEKQELKAIVSTNKDIFRYSRGMKQMIYKALYYCFGVSTASKIVIFAQKLIA